jgi:hypothetical protein
LWCSVAKVIVKKSWGELSQLLNCKRCTFGLTQRCTGWQICIWTVGVASKPIEPRPPYFACFHTYGKRKFVENLKLIGALLWKLLSFQFYTAMYIPCNLEFMKKRPEAVARSWWVLQKICFITFKSYISKQFFLIKIFFFLNQSMTSQWPPKIVPIHICHPVIWKKEGLWNKTISIHTVVKV